MNDPREAGPARSTSAAGFGLNIVLLTGAMFSGLIFVVVAPVLPALASHFTARGDSTHLAQWMMTAPAVGLVIGGLFGGWLFDRLGPRLLLPLAYIVYGIAGTTGAYLESPAALLAGRALTGFCAVILSLGTTVVIAGRFEEPARSRMLGYKNAVAAGVGIFAMLVAGQVAAGYGWRAPFLIYGVSLLFLLPAMIVLRRVAPPAPVAPGAEGFGSALSKTWLIYAVTVLFGIVTMAPLTQLPFLLAEIGIEGAQKLSVILVGTSVGSTVGAFLYGRIFARLGVVRTFLFDMAVWGTGMLVLGTTASEVQAGIGCLLTGIASGIFVVHMANLLVVRVAPEQRGRAVGLLYVALFVGDFMTPIVLIPIAEAFSRPTMFLLVGAVCAAVFAIVASRQLQLSQKPAAGQAL